MDQRTEELSEYAQDLNILYVEDDIQTLELETMLFEMFFKTVDTAINGLEALEKYNNYYEQTGKFYDIVVTDLNMPRMDGVEFCKNILEKNEHQVVIIISANDNMEKIVNLINMGINYFLQKPIDNTKMYNVLYKAVKLVNNEKQLLEKTELLNEQKEYLEVELQHKTLTLYQRLYYDNLTKLPKRNKLIEDIEKLDIVGLLIVNINDFKNINSVYGNHIGDKVLVEFSAFLLNIALERGCNLYNIGADEFVLLNINNTQEDYCKNSAKIVIETIEKSGLNIQIDDEYINISLGVTIGIARGKENILDNAHMALEYAQKKKDEYCLYSKELKVKKDSTDDIETTKLIKLAIEQDQVCPYFQPILLENGTKKYESLIRIEKGGKVISPFYFLDIAKKIRYYEKLTRIMIKKSFEVFSSRDEDFSVNLSFEDIINTKTVDFLIENIKKYQVQNKLIIELLESENIDDFNIVKEFIQKVKQMGVKIAIDDFGSGYSNFSYLLDIKPDFIKIDGSIIQNIHIDKDSYMIAQTIVEFSKKLGAQTVAEYIHNDEVYEKAKELGIDAFQGFYFSEPKKEIA